MSACADSILSSLPALIGVSSFLGLASATTIAPLGFQRDAALAAVVSVRIVKASQGWHGYGGVAT